MISTMLKGIIIFGGGIYTGVYIAQNYQIDKVEDPKVLYEKAKAFICAKLTEFNDGKKGGD
ncbi:hypothetical protein KGM_211192 [Danaus plexippus plexippus]|uniref:Uncharacterized protein n=1 Tax=Danaus plexippus plexippus TaxID=278856 RepID=A0A212EN08_DANPL|nr:hypothetical protein KGM_211192 [Danaus plexippus plexippus]